MNAAIKLLRKEELRLSKKIALIKRDYGANPARYSTKLISIRRALFLLGEHLNRNTCRLCNYNHNGFCESRESPNYFVDANDSCINYKRRIYLTSV